LTDTTAGRAHAARFPAPKHLLKVGVWLLLITYLAFTLIPYAWLIDTSLRPESQAVQVPVRLIPKTLTLSNYADIFGSAGQQLGLPISDALVNTIIVGLGSTGLALLIGLPAAYSFAKYSFPTGRVLFVLILVTRMFPIVALAIPLFSLINKLGLYDTRLGLILAYSALTLPFTIWLMYSFFRQVPPELEEAARIDGCGFLRMFIKVVLPVSVPGIVATFLLSLIYPWNDLLLSSVLSSSPRSETLAATLAQYNTGNQILWAHLSASGVVATAPILVLTLVLQRYIVRGLTMGAVKG
jgi:multiple sugar transport system permease protein